MAATASRDSLAFTVVVTVLVCLGALPMLLILALSSAPGDHGPGDRRWPRCRSVPLVACYLWLDRYEPEPRRLLAAGPAVGRLRRDRGALVVQGVGGLVAGVTDEVSARRRRAGHRGGQQGAVPAPAAVVAPGRARRRPRRHRLRRHGRHRLRLHREHPLPRRGYNGTDGMGPGGARGVTTHLRASAACSARSRTRCSPRSSASASGIAVELPHAGGAAPGARSAATCCAVLAHGAVERLDDLRRRGLRRRLRRLSWSRRSSG